MSSLPVAPAAGSARADDSTSDRTAVLGVVAFVARDSGIFFVGREGVRPLEPPPSKGRCASVSVSLHND